MCGRASLPLVAASVAAFGATVFSGELPLGDLAHDGPPTPEQLSLYLPVTGELDVSAAATVRYRKAGGGEWRTGHPLHRIRPANTEGRKPADAFAGVIWDLEPGAAYEVEVTVKLGDASVVRTLSASTRPLPGPAGPPTKKIEAGATAAQIQAVLDSAQPGDVIQFANGTCEVDKLQIRKGGTGDKPVVIRGETRNGTILKDPTGMIIQVLDVSDVIIENLTLEGSKTDSGTAASSHGINFWSGGKQQKRVTVRNVTISGVDMGIVASGNPEQLLIYDNTLTGNNVWEKDFLETNRTWNDDGIRIPGMGNVAFNNTLSGFGDSLAVIAGAQNAGVHFYRNDIRMTGDDAFEGDYGVRNITFYDNRIHNSMTLISFDPIHGGPAFAFRNIAINVGRAPYKLNNRNTGFFLYNNTVVRTEGCKSGAGWGWVQFDNGPLVAWGYRNNILIYRGPGKLLAMESSGQSFVDFDHNAWYPDRAVWWTKSGGSFPNIATAREKLKPTMPVFSDLTRRHEGDIICEADPFAEPIELGENYLTLIARQYVPALAEQASPRNKGAVIPGVTDGFEGKAPDMGAIIKGRPVPVWGDRSAAKGK
ncbi:MAG: right-handed parallel beta-helix repeat-containing protein [Planctomycetota bacterium]|nr:right-handed parallel beta-helix repeat-containing protein [Planctomycetota bacterium]